MNRTQAAVVGFIISAWLALVVTFIARPSLYDTQLHQIALAGQPGLRAAFVAAIGLLLIVLTIGTVRRWRWLFWLLLIAFATGLVRIPLLGLQLLGLAPLGCPPVVCRPSGRHRLRAGGDRHLAMYAGYRKHGLWGAF